MGSSTEQGRQTAVGLAYRLCESFNAVDFDSMRAVLAPDVVFEDFQHAPDQDPIVHGIDEMLKTFRFYLDSFEDFSTELINPLPVGDNAVAGTVEWRATGAGSEVPIVHRTVDVVWVSDGRITHYVSGFRSFDDALKAIEEDRRPA